MKDETLEIMMQLTPYEGKEDYAFISYSHQDIDLVLPVLLHLQENGIRFWYDDGIEAGTEWSEEIGRRLNECRVCLAFISPNSLESENCRDEIVFARDKKKDILSIILSPVEMTSGMQLQLARRQFLTKYKYPSEAYFLKKLLNLALIKNCQSGQHPESGTTDAAIEQPAAPRTANVLINLNYAYTDLPFDPLIPPNNVFGSNLIRRQISTITILDNLHDLPPDAWDVSQARDSSVMAWVKPNGDLFDLYIGAEGGVTAPADCSNLFACYGCLESIHFNGIFNTANVTNMLYMFDHCIRLTTLDLSSFNTAKVTNMQYMFANCRSLTALDLSSFDTSKVTSMDWMFQGCENLTTLYVRNWNTSNIDTTNMFDRCSLSQEVVSDILSGRTVSTT